MLNDNQCLSVPSPAGALAIPRAFFGSGFGRIHLDDLDCDGTENGLINCSHNGIQEHNCGHSEDAGAICIGQCFLSLLPTTGSLPPIILILSLNFQRLL